MTYRLLCRVGR